MLLLLNKYRLLGRQHNQEGLFDQSRPRLFHANFEQ